MGLIKRILSSCQKEPDKEEAESSKRFQHVSQSQLHLTAAITPEVKHFTSFPSLRSVLDLTDFHQLPSVNPSLPQSRKVSQSLERRLCQLSSSDKEKHTEEEKVISSILKTTLLLLSTSEEK